MLSVGSDFDQSIFHKHIDTSWTEASTENVDWLLNGREQAIQNI
jgi:hypothetical protein